MLYFIYKNFWLILQNPQGRCNFLVDFVVWACNILVTASCCFFLTVYRIYKQPKEMRRISANNLQILTANHQRDIDKHKSTEAPESWSNHLLIAKYQSKLVSCGV